MGGGAGGGGKKKKEWETIVEIIKNVIQWDDQWKWGKNIFRCFCKY